MADGNNLFNNVYVVTKSGSTYTSGAFSSANAAVTEVSDKTNGKTSDDLKTLGDLSNDSFTFGGTTYTYIGTTGDGAFVASSGSGSSATYRLFSDSPVAPNTQLTVDTRTSGTTAICFLPGTRVAIPDGE